MSSHLRGEGFEHLPPQEHAVSHPILSRHHLLRLLVAQPCRTYALMAVTDTELERRRGGGECRHHLVALSRPLLQDPLAAAAGALQVAGVDPVERSLQFLDRGRMLPGIELAGRELQIRLDGMEIGRICYWVTVAETRIEPLHEMTFDLGRLARALALPDDHAAVWSDSQGRLEAALALGAEGETEGGEGARRQDFRDLETAMEAAHRAVGAGRLAEACDRLGTAAGLVQELRSRQDVAGEILEAWRAGIKDLTLTLRDRLPAELNGSPGERGMSAS